MGLGGLLRNKNELAPTKLTQRMLKKIIKKIAVNHEETHCVSYSLHVRTINQPGMVPALSAK